MKKILIYNWTRIDDKDGGGVNVYCKNIINKLLQNPNNDITYINSGKNYDLIRKKVYYKSIKNNFNKNLKTYEILNSPIMYAGLQFNRVDIYNNDEQIKNVFEKFLEETGPYDVIHFNNLEGLSINVLLLKEKYPNTKFIFSMHNYFPICPNVYLWSHNFENCKDYKSGKKCVNCIYCDYNYFKNRMKIMSFIKKIGINLESKLMKKIMNIFILKKKNSIKEINNVGCNDKDYKEFREKNILYINKYIDYVLCVSKRVKEIAIKNGIDETKTVVSYIGTKFADNLKKPNEVSIENGFNLLYMGYMDKKKGFDFLIDSLKILDNKVAQKINLYLVCRNDKSYDIESIKDELSKKFKSVNYKDGYTHEELNEILSNKHLGIVPVVWEDNLPQITIEMSSNGIPVLASSLGGASELCKSKLFVFEGNNPKEFNKKLSNLVNNPDILKEYWKNYQKPTTMKKHIEELDMYYSK